MAEPPKFVLDVIQQHGTFVAVTVGFGSLVFIPLVGVLELLKKRPGVSSALAIFLVVWLVVGSISIGGGIHPVGPGDIVTREDIQTWFGLPIVKFVLKLWLAGFAVGIPLLIITGVYEYTKKLSKILSIIAAAVAVIDFCTAVYFYITLVIIPQFFR
jgi:hypothetical protein